VEEEIACCMQCLRNLNISTVECRIVDAEYIAAAALVGGSARMPDDDEEIDFLPLCDGQKSSDGNQGPIGAKYDKERSLAFRRKSARELAS
jgi:hypothetical protein